MRFPFNRFGLALLIQTAKPIGKLGFTPSYFSLTTGSSICKSGPTLGVHTTFNEMIVTKDFLVEPFAVRLFRLHACTAMRQNLRPFRA